MNYLHRYRIAVYLLLMACAPKPVVAAPFKAPQAVEVYVAGQDGYTAYRIPAVISTAKGTLLAFAEGRKDSGGDNGNIDTVLKRSTDQGLTWSKLSVVCDMGTDAICNPCPVIDRSNGRIWLPLIWKAGENRSIQNKRGTGRGTMEVFMLFSDDDGLTWSKPENITAQVKRPGWTWVVTGPGNGVQLSSGRLLIPCDHRKKKDENEKASYSHVIFSDDHGKTWQIGGECERKTNECQVAELANGNLLMSIRSHDSPDKLRAFSTSTDQGQTWSAVHFAKDVPDPTCQGSLIRLPDVEGDSLLFSNPASTKRERMTVRLSKDGGLTWAHSRVLDEGPAAYSSLVALPDGRAGCLYEQGTGRGKDMVNLVFVTFDLAWLRAKPR